MRIIIVDSEPGFRKALAMGLRFPGIVVDTRDSGRNAIQTAREIKYDILITDLDITDMDGLDMIRIMKKENPTLRTIVLTGNSRIDFANRDLLREIESIHCKPVHFDTVFCALEFAMKRRIPH